MVGMVVVVVVVVVVEIVVVVKLVTAIKGRVIVPSHILTSRCITEGATCIV